MNLNSTVMPATGSPSPVVTRPRNDGPPWPPEPAVRVLDSVLLSVLRLALSPVEVSSPGGRASSLRVVERGTAALVAALVAALGSGLLVPPQAGSARAKTPTTASTPR